MVKEKSKGEAMATQNVNDNDAPEQRQPVDNDNDNDDDDESSNPQDLMHQCPIQEHSQSVRHFWNLPVGRFHVVEVVVHVRRMDLEWFRAGNNINQEEILGLLQASVLPRMCGAELEAYYRKRFRDNEFPPEISGEKNLEGGADNNTNKNTKKRKRKQTKKNQQENDPLAVRLEETPEKEVYYAFGETIQLAYRRKQIKTRQHTLTMSRADDGDLQFSERIRLSHRLLLWCCKLDPSSKTNPDPPNFGFYRQEMIPLSSLFRDSNSSSNHRA